MSTRRTWSAGCKRWAILQKTGLQFTPWIKWWSRWTLTAYSHYTQHQFFPPSAGVAVMPCNGITKVQCNWALIMRRPHLSCMSARPPLMSLLGVHALLVVNAVMRSLKSTARSRAVRSWTSRPDSVQPPIRFESDLSRLDSIQIQYLNRFEPYSLTCAIHECLRNDYHT